MLIPTGAFWPLSLSSREKIYILFNETNDVELNVISIFVFAVSLHVTALPFTGNAFSTISLSSVVIQVGLYRI